MKNYLHYLTLFLLYTATYAQTWTTEVISFIPEKVSNNAVTMATINGQPFVYSFSGIDETKKFDGIHLQSFRYDVTNNIWETIPSLPDDRGKIAAGASTVNNKIYIMGGYHVFPNGNETSSEKVHIYDPESNTYLADGSPIPVPIDDHIQAVWKDSLIFIVTGWSDNTNVPNVQIYNPALDTWQVGTPVPNNNDYKVFGGSGEIIGDTIYYIGGARFQANFPLGSHFRKGYINPNDPTDIQWETESITTALGYRMAATKIGNQLLWIGGSDVSYNYDGIAYNGSGGVSPTNTIVNYDPIVGKLIEIEVNFPIMDLRGIAKINDYEFISVGGMENQQQVTDKVYRLSNLDFVGLNNHSTTNIQIYPNPITDFLTIQTPKKAKIKIWDIQSKLVKEIAVQGKQIIDVQDLQSNLYLVQIITSTGMLTRKIWKQ